MNYVLILSNHDFFNQTGAAVSRIISYAKALALNPDTTVFLSSFDYINVSHKTEIHNNIFILGNLPEKKLPLWKRAAIFFTYRDFIKNLDAAIYHLKGNIVVFDYALLVKQSILLIYYFKIKRGIKLFYEKCETRTAILENTLLSFKTFKEIRFTLTYPYLWISAWVQDRMVVFYNGVVVISSALEKWTKPYNSAIIKVPCMVDMEKFTHKSSVDTNPNEFNIGYTGQVTLKKDGLLDIIMAINPLIQRGEKVVLNIYGPALRKDMELLMKYISAEKIEHAIKFHGNIPGEKIPQVLTSQNLLIVTRQANKQSYYSLSTKLAEYMASGKLVLATDVGDNGLYIKNGINGFILKSGDIKAYTKLIHEIIKGNYDLISLGANARKTADQYFNYKNYSKTLCRFFYD